MRFAKKNFGRLAQLGEHRPYKPRVTSSSLVPPTIFKDWSISSPFFVPCENMSVLQRWYLHPVMSVSLPDVLLWMRIVGGVAGRL